MESNNDIPGAETEHSREKASPVQEGQAVDGEQGPFQFVYFMLEALDLRYCRGFSLLRWIPFTAAVVTLFCSAAIAFKPATGFAEIMRKEAGRVIVEEGICGKSDPAQHVDPIPCILAWGEVAVDNVEGQPGAEIRGGSVIGELLGLSIVHGLASMAVIAISFLAAPKRFNWLRLGAKTIFFCGGLCVILPASIVSVLLLSQEHWVPSAGSQLQVMLNTVMSASDARLPLDGKERLNSKGQTAVIAHFEPKKQYYQALEVLTNITDTVQHVFKSDSEYTSRDDDAAQCYLRNEPGLSGFFGSLERTTAKTTIPGDVLLSLLRKKPNKDNLRLGLVTLFRSNSIVCMFEEIMLCRGFDDGDCPSPGKYGPCASGYGAQTTEEFSSDSCRCYSCPPRDGVETHRGCASALLTRAKLVWVHWKTGSIWKTKSYALGREMVLVTFLASLIILSVACCA